MAVNNTDKQGVIGETSHTHIWGEAKSVSSCLSYSLKILSFPEKQSGNLTNRLQLFFNLFPFPYLPLTLSFEVYDGATMHPSIYYFNQRESKVLLPGELHRKTNAIFLLITALTRSREC